MTIIKMKFYFTIIICVLFSTQTLAVPNNIPDNSELAWWIGHTGSTSAVEAATTDDISKIKLYSNDSEFHVRWATVYNPNNTFNVMKTLSDDRDSDVRKSVKKILILRWPNETAKQKLADHKKEEALIWENYTPKQKISHTKAFSKYTKSNGVFISWTSSKHEETRSNNRTFDVAVSDLNLSIYEKFTRELTVLNAAIGSLQPTDFKAPDIIKGEFEKTNIFKERSSRTTLSAKKLFNEQEKINAKALRVKKNELSKLVKSEDDYYFKNMSSVIRNLFGNPTISSLNYDADKELFNVNIVAENYNNYKIKAKVPVSLKNAKEIKTALSKAKAVIFYRHARNEFLATGVILEVEGEFYNGEVTNQLTSKLKYGSKAGKKDFALKLKKQAAVLKKQKEAEAAIPKTDQELIDNYQATTQVDKKCKKYIQNAITVEDRIKVIQKKATSSSRYYYNQALNDYVAAVLNVKKTCSNSNSAEMKRITYIMVRVAVLRQRILLGLE